MNFADEASRGHEVREGTANIRPLFQSQRAFLTSAKSHVPHHLVRCDPTAQSLCPGAELLAGFLQVEDEIRVRLHRST